MEIFSSQSMLESSRRSIECTTKPKLTFTDRTRSFLWFLSKSDFPHFWRYFSKTEIAELQVGHPTPILIAMIDVTVYLVCAKRIRCKQNEFRGQRLEPAAFLIRLLSKESFNRKTCRTTHSLLGCLSTNRQEFIILESSLVCVCLQDFV